VTTTMQPGLFEATIDGQHTTDRDDFDTLATGWLKEAKFSRAYGSDLPQRPAPISVPRHWQAQTKAQQRGPICTKLSKVEREWLGRSVSYVRKYVRYTGEVWALTPGRNCVWVWSAHGGFTAVEISELKPI